MSDAPDLRQELAALIDELRSDGEFASPSTLEELLIRCREPIPKDGVITLDVPIEFAQVFANNWFDGQLWVDARRAMGDALVAAGLPLMPPEDREEGNPSGSCDEEIRTWDVFRPEQIDLYWMQCDRLGPHTEHRNSETGATWRTPDEAEHLRTRTEVRRTPSGAWGCYLDGELISDHATRDGAVAAVRNHQREAS